MLKLKPKTVIPEVKIHSTRPNQWLSIGISQFGEPSSRVDRAPRPLQHTLHENEICLSTIIILSETRIGKVELFEIVEFAFPAKNKRLILLDTLQ